MSKSRNNSTQITYIIIYCLKSNFIRFWDDGQDFNLKECIDI